jgi:hypothetical protein
MTHIGVHGLTFVGEAAPEAPSCSKGAPLLDIGENFVYQEPGRYRFLVGNP